MTRDPFLNYDGLMAHGVRRVQGYHGNALARYESLLRSGAPALPELLNMRWVYTNVDSLAPEAYERVVGPVTNAFGSTVYLYRYREEHPLAWVVPLALKAPDDVALATLAEPGYPVRSVAIFPPEANVTAGEPNVPPPLEIEARTTAYEPGYIAIELSAPAPEGSALVVSENYYPGWSVQVDGRPVTAERANYTFIGVPLSAGAQRVQLRFVSTTYGSGKRITLLAIAVALVLWASGAILDRRRA
jgi:hypothetical protein